MEIRFKSPSCIEHRDDGSWPISVTLQADILGKAYLAQLEPPKDASEAMQFGCHRRFLKGSRRRNAANNSVFVLNLTGVYEAHFDWELIAGSAGRVLFAIDRVPGAAVLNVLEVTNGSSIKRSLILGAVSLQAVVSPVLEHPASAIPLEYDDATLERVRAALRVLREDEESPDLFSIYEKSQK